MRGMTEEREKKEVIFMGDILIPSDTFFNDLGINFKDPEEKIKVFEELFGNWEDLFYLEDCKIRLIVNERKQLETISFSKLHTRASNLVREKLKEFQVDEDIRLQLEHELVNGIELLVDSISKIPIK